MNRRRVQPLRFALILLVPLLLGAGGRDVETRIGEVAVTYAQGFEPLLRSDPTEAARLGVAVDDLARLEPSAIHQLNTVDARFRSAYDTRDVDDALVATDVWWVVLSVDTQPRLVVSVQWPAGADDPQPVGLGWVSAEQLTGALAKVSGQSASVVYLPEDASFVLGQEDRGVSAMPIASEALTARLELPRAPVGVAEYTDSLRVRLDHLADEVLDAQPGSGGGSGPVPASSSLSHLALAVLLLPLGLLALTAVVPGGDLRRRVRRGGHRE